MRAGLDRSVAAAKTAAVEQHPSGLVDRLELDPDVERVDGAARKKVADLARAHDDLDADRVAAADRRFHAIERRDHFGGRRERRGA